MHSCRCVYRGPAFCPLGPHAFVAVPVAFAIHDQLRCNRIGPEHLAAVEELCLCITSKFPGCLIQFEDFQTDAAFEILEHLREKVLCFNDDIQGTGAVVLCGFINGMKAQGTDMKVVLPVTFCVDCCLEAAWLPGSRRV